jgi:surface protein
VTRAQIATFLWKEAGSPAAPNKAFTDEASIPTWARTATDWLWAQNITRSDPFKPGGLVTRADMAAFLWKAAGSPAAPNKAFADEASIPTWARTATDWLWAQGISVANPFKPADKVSRGQMAAFLYRWKGEPALGETLGNTNGTAAVLWYDVRGTANRTITLPLFQYGSVIVNWGDGTQNTFNGLITRPTKTYAADGYYRVRVVGGATAPQPLTFGFADTVGDFGANTAARQLVAVSSFGTLNPTSMNQAFYGAANLQRVPRNLPPTVTDLRRAFSGPFSNSLLRTVAPTSFNDPAVSTWDTGNVTRFDSMFLGATAFNQPIGSWDMSSATHTAEMFYKASAFNQPIGTWDVRNVVDMGSMFHFAAAFNQPLADWDTGSANAMYFMFAEATAFNQPLDLWDTANVTSMWGMFLGADRFNQPLSSWNTSKVTTMETMFSDAGRFNGDISGWDTSRVASFKEMFYKATAFNQNIAGWNTAAAKDMGGMFRQATSFNQPIGNWNTANVTSFYGMFDRATSFNQPIGSWNTAKVTDTGFMFAGATAFNRPLGTWNTANVIAMDMMFDGAVMFNQPLNAWNTAKVTSTGHMFRGAIRFNQPLNAWNTTKVTFMSRMFENAASFNQNISGWNVAAVRSDGYVNFRAGSPLSAANTPARFR